MITPSDSPSNPSGYASVTPSGQGPAPYDIQAPQEDLSAVLSGSVSTAMARQPEALRLLESPQGYGAQDITAGFAGGGGESWPSNPNPIGIAQTPDQGMGDFQGTGTD